VKAIDLGCVMRNSSWVDTGKYTIRGPSPVERGHISATITPGVYSGLLALWTDRYARTQQAWDGYSGWKPLEPGYPCTAEGDDRRGHPKFIGKPNPPRQSG
jgi:hypothetical protein